MTSRSLLYAVDCLVSVQSASLLGKVAFYLAFFNMHILELVRTMKRLLAGKINNNNSSLHFRHHGVLVSWFL